MNIAVEGRAARKTAAESEEREFDFRPDDLTVISRLVYQKSGIVLDGKDNLVYSRLSRRLRVLNLKSFREYIALLESRKGADEIGNAINALTTNLTRFFREDHHFEHLKDNVIKPKLSATRGRRFRIWSAGCSTGQEAYSTALTLADTVPDLGRHDARILATDLDSNVVSRGNAGEYSAAEVDSIPLNMRNRFLRKLDDAGERYQFKNSIRSMITFGVINLLEDWPMKGPFDAIFFRNVAIYFDLETQRRIIAKLHRLLADDGFLYVGHSETLSRVSSDLELCGRTIYRKRGVSG